MNPTTAVVLAGGRGERVGTESPKQFVDLAGKPLLMHSVDLFGASARIDSIVVVLTPDRPDFVGSLLSDPKIISVVDGGPSRQASLAEGLSCLPEDTETVLVHDAARPMVTLDFLERLLDALAGRFSGAIPVLAVDEAIKEISSVGEVLASKSREALYRAQTPQAFVREALEDSLARVDAQGINCEDCSEMLLRAGYRVNSIAGDPLNLKVTYARDFALCESIFAARKAL